MSMTESVTIDPNLKMRLAALAEREGYSFDEFVATVLSRHAEQSEREIIDRAEDEQRWQRYLDTGVTIPFETVQNKLRKLASHAAQSAEPQ